MYKPTGIVLVATGAWLAIAGCRCPPETPPVPEPPDVNCGLTDVDSKQINDPCPPPSCGGNSPLVNAFPINGLHPDGCKNVDGASLQKGVEIGGTICERLAGGVTPYLDYALVDEAAPELGYELVARDPRDNKILCRRDELVGVVFEVDVPPPSTAPGPCTPSWQKQSVQKFRIGHAARTNARVFASSQSDCQSGCQRKRSVSDKPRVVYLITRSGESQSVCMNPPPGEEPDAPAVIVHQPHHGNQVSRGGDAQAVEDLAEALQEDLPLYAMVVPGAVYNFRAGLIAKSFLPAQIEAGGGSGDSHGSHRWFNLACATDALAQTELLGLASRPSRTSKPDGGAAAQPPLSGSERRARDRLPALHMLTAKYYKGRSATTRGTPIAWHWKDRASHASEPNKFPVEAVWGETGAKCVSHSRLWRKNKVVYVPRQVRELFQGMVNQPMNEQQFLKIICEESKASDSHQPEGQQTEGIVKQECPYTEDDLVSRAPEHSDEDNDTVLLF